MGRTHSRDYAGANRGYGPLPIKASGGMMRRPLVGTSYIGLIFVILR